MFRKHFRFRRLVLGLAFAAMAAPVAQAGTQPSYLGYHEVGYPVAAGPQAKAQRATVTPLQADGLRWQAIANAYRSRQATITPRNPRPSRINPIINSQPR